MPDGSIFAQITIQHRCCRYGLPLQLQLELRPEQPGMDRVQIEIKLLTAPAVLGGFTFGGIPYLGLKNGGCGVLHADRLP